MIQALLVDGDLAVAEPKTLRYRLLHMAARIIRHARQVILRLALSLGGPSDTRYHPACQIKRTRAVSSGQPRSLQ